MTIREVLAYITADVHGYYIEFHKALDEAGVFHRSRAAQADHPWRSLTSHGASGLK